MVARISTRSPSPVIMTASSVNRATPSECPLAQVFPLLGRALFRIRRSSGIVRKPTSTVRTSPSRTRATVSTGHGQRRCNPGLKIGGRSSESLNDANLVNRNGREARREPSGQRQDRKPDEDPPPLMRQLVKDLIEREPPDPAIDGLRRTANASHSTGGLRALEGQQAASSSEVPGSNRAGGTARQQVALADTPRAK